MATETLRPNGAGAETNCTISGSSPAATNWQSVDEVVADENVTYVFVGEGYDKRDLYALANSAVGAGIINSVTVWARGRFQVGAGTLYLALRSDSTVGQSGAKALGGAWGNHSNAWNNPPEGGSWTWAKIDAMQAGVRLIAAAGKGEAALCTQVYVVVDYTAVSLPTVTTQAADLIEATTARGNGNITATGGEDCDIRGIVWDLATHGDPGNVAPGASGYANNVAETPGPFGTGPFTRSLTGLPTGDTIYARAYAHNSAGYDYGAEVNFLTKPAAPTSVSATDGVYTDKVVVTWVKSTGATGYQVYRDGTPLGWLGDVATFDDTGAGAPSITKGTVTASDGTYNDKVRLDASGYGTNNGATHTYKVRAKNATGESGDSGTNTGYRKPGTLYRQWQKSAADSDASYSNISGATADPYDYTGAPAPTVTPGTATASDGATAYVTLSLAGESANIGAGRWYRAVYTAAGCTSQTTLGNRGYRGVGAVTRQWYRSSGDSDAGYGVLGGATTDPYNDTTAPAPTITHGSITAGDGSSTANVPLSNTGASANIGAGRWYKCLVSATGAAAQYSEADRGYRGVGALTYQWYRSSGDSDDDYAVLAGATSSTHNDTTAPAPIVTPGAGAASDGTSSVHVTLSLAGESANIGAGRYYKCYHTATGAAPGYTGVDRGYRGVGALTYQWQRSAADSDDDYGNIIGATTEAYNDTGAPGNGEGRYYQCVENATGAAEQTSSSDRGYRWMGEKTAHMAAKMMAAGLI